MSPPCFRNVIKAYKKRFRDSISNFKPSEDILPVHVTEDVTKVDMEELTVLLHHDIVTVTIRHAKHVSSSVLL